MIRTLCVVLLSSSLALAQAPARKAVEAKNGMVVCVCPIAAQIGADTLKAGGNAVDASVAVAFALAVTWPEAGNIGGGGFMMVWPGTGKEPTCFDYREMAPALATKCRALFAASRRPTPSSASSSGPTSCCPRSSSRGTASPSTVHWRQV